MLSRLALRNAQMLPVMAQRAQATSTTAVERPKRRIEPGPTRLGIVPEEWFTFFYRKTGVTGPYMFGLGVTTYLLSKEIYILEHEFYSGCSLFLVLCGGYYKYKTQINDFLEKGITEYEKVWENSRESEIKEAEDFIEELKKEKWRCDIQKMIMDAKKENIKMQLEAAYRQRVAHVYSEVKKRLDFQLQLVNVERKIAQKHMVQWIISNVHKSVTPDLEKSALHQCIKDLQALAVKA